MLSRGFDVEPMHSLCWLHLCYLPRVGSHPKSVQRNFVGVLEADDGAAGKDSQTLDDTGGPEVLYTPPAMTLSAQHLGPLSYTGRSIPKLSRPHQARLQNPSRLLRRWNRIRVVIALSAPIYLPPCRPSKRKAVCIEGTIHGVSHNKIVPGERGMLGRRSILGKIVGVWKRIHGNGSENLRDQSLLLVLESTES